MRIEVERCMHRPCGVVWRNIERAEVVVIVLDLRTFGDIEPQLREQGDSPVEGQSDGVKTAWPLAAPWQRDIDSLALELAHDGGPFQLGALRLNTGGNCRFGVVDLFAKQRPFLWRKRPQLLHLFREDALLAQ